MLRIDVVHGTATVMASTIVSSFVHAHHLRLLVFTEAFNLTIDDTQTCVFLHAVDLCAVA